MCYQLVLTTLLVLALAPLPSSGQNLTTCQTRSQDPFSESTTDESTGATFYIDLNNPFTCHGVIKQWRFCYKRSPGALFDTIQFGVYAPDSDGDTYIKKGSNSFYISPLKNQDCLYRDADPQLVVQEGYYIAWYASLIFIEYFDDPVHGHLYRSVAFPDSISHGVLIRTPDIRAPKIHALLQNLDPAVTTSTSATVSSSTTGISATVSSSVTTVIVVQPTSTENAQSESVMLPSPLETPTTPMDSSLGIPPPDLNPQQCNLGVGELFTTSFQQVNGVYLNHIHVSMCSGHVSRFVFCYRFVESTSHISIGIWRRTNSSSDEFAAVEEFGYTIETEGIHHIDPLICTAVSVSSTQSIAPDDVIGFRSSNIEMAFGNRSTEISTKNNDENVIPLLRAIIDVQSPTMEPSSSVPATTATAKSGNIGALLGGIVGGVLGAVAIVVIAMAIIMLAVFFSFKNKGNRLRSQTQTSMVYNTAYGSKQKEDDDVPMYSSLEPKDDLGTPPHGVLENPYEEIDPYNKLKHS